MVCSMFINPKNLNICDLNFMPAAKIISLGSPHSVNTILVAFTRSSIARLSAYFYRKKLTIVIFSAQNFLFLTKRYQYIPSPTACMVLQMELFSLVNVSVFSISAFIFNWYTSFLTRVLILMPILLLHNCFSFVSVIERYNYSFALHGNTIDHC